MRRPPCLRCQVWQFRHSDTQQPTLYQSRVGHPKNRQTLGWPGLHKMFKKLQIFFVNTFAMMKSRRDHRNSTKDLGIWKKKVGERKKSRNIGGPEEGGLGEQVQGRAGPGRGVGESGVRGRAGPGEGGPGDWSCPTFCQNSGTRPRLGQNSATRPKIGYNAATRPRFGQNSGKAPIKA